MIKKYRCCCFFANEFFNRYVCIVFIHLILVMCSAEPNFGCYFVVAVILYWCSNFIFSSENQPKKGQGDWNGGRSSTTTNNTNNNNSNKTLKLNAYIQSM